MRSHAQTPARAGLAGNPSDGYGGRAVAVVIPCFEAEAAIETGVGIRISSPREADLSLDSPRSLLEARSAAAGSRHRLAVACCRRFLGTAFERGWIDEIPAAADGFHLTYGSDIPYRVGLAGSSALIISMLRVLAARYQVSIPTAELPSLALAVETRELAIHGGLMDRVAQVLGGVVYMDLSTALISETGGGRYEALPLRQLPDLFVAWHPDLSAGSETVHNALRERVERGEARALTLLAELADLADEARRILLSAFPCDLATIMDANFELRARLVEVGAGNRLMVETGRRLGAGVKQAGSGGAVVGVYDGDPGRLERLRLAYDQIGARFVVPTFDTAPRAGSRPSAEDHPSLPRPGGGEAGETGLA